MKINKPYVYILKNKTTGFMYIGSKYSKNANPKNFWITYFTSSNLVKLLIKFYGVEDIKFKKGSLNVVSKNRLWVMMGIKII